jgi:hypothetical protein
MTFQQVQKFERGSNRIGASRLYQLSKILDSSACAMFSASCARRRHRRSTPTADRVPWRCRHFSASIRKGLRLTLCEGRVLAGPSADPIG